MRASETATMTDRKHAVGRPAAGALAAAAPVLVAVWCRSVGTSWTLELHELDGGAASRMIVDWISTGVPISQPEPDALACELLAERGLHLFRDPSAGPWTRSRYGIGYVCRNAELIELAHVVRDHATETGVHPVGLAAQWVAAGFSAEAAARWIREGVHSPQAAQVFSERTVSATHTVRSQGHRLTVPGDISAAGAKRAAPLGGGPKEGSTRAGEGAMRSRLRSIEAGSIPGRSSCTTNVSPDR